MGENRPLSLTEGKASLSLDGGHCWTLRGSRAPLGADRGRASGRRRWREPKFHQLGILMFLVCLVVCLFPTSGWMMTSFLFVYLPVIYSLRYTISCRLGQLHGFQNIILIDVFFKYK
jgi:hypothetical protein